MPKTIARLLSKLKIEHNIELNTPLLALPLSLFKEQDYAELITILWLSGQNWIDPNKATKPGTVMGNVSHEHVRLFYSSVKNEISRALLKMKETRNKEDVEPFSITSKPNIWVNPTQVTHFVKDNPIYILLSKSSNCPQELAFFLKWIASDGILSIDELIFETHLLHLNIESRQQRIDSLVLLLPTIEPFKNHPAPVHLVYEILNKINQQLASPCKENVSAEILTFYKETLISLASQYPPTLESLMLSLGIVLPTNLSIQLTTLLRQDLLQVPGLTEEDWPELVYYASLFIFNHSQANLFLVNFTYSGVQLPAALSVLAQKHAKNFQLWMTTQEYDNETITSDFGNFLSAELKENGIDVHPILLGLLCFENCNPLKSLMVKTWTTMGMSVSQNTTIALKSSSNRFVLGELICRNDEYFPICNSDLILLEQLISIAKKQKKEASLTKSFPGQQDFSFFPPAKQPNTSKGVPTIQSTYISPPHCMTVNELEFVCIKNQLADLTLANSLTLDSMDDFSFTFAVNYTALISFISEYSIDSANSLVPSYQALADFFKVMENPSRFELVLEELIRSEEFINLDGVETLSIQLIHLDRTLTKLNSLVSSSQESQTDNDNLHSLRLKWLNYQQEIFTLFKERVLHAQKLIIESGETADDDRYSYGRGL